MVVIIVGCGKTGRSIAEQLNDEEHDIYYIEENGIHLCPNGYSLGDLGQCWGQSIDITIEKDGYRVDVMPITEI